MQNRIDDAVQDHEETVVKAMAGLSGKVALITGAGSGIGKAAAVAFARNRKLGS